MIGILFAIAVSGLGFWLLSHRPKVVKERMSDNWRYEMVDESSRQRSKGWSLR